MVYTWTDLSLWAYMLLLCIASSCSYRPQRERASSSDWQHRRSCVYDLMIMMLSSTDRNQSLSSSWERLSGQPIPNRCPRINRAHASLPFTACKRVVLSMKSGCFLRDLWADSCGPGYLKYSDVPGVDLCSFSPFHFYPWTSVYFMSSWTPKRTLQECDSILCGPGTAHEIETCLVDGRVQRVYKNLWPSLRHFWMWATEEYREKTYLVYENRRYTFGEVFHMTVQAAAIYRENGITKGDRISICSRNLPEYLVAYWAGHLVGAITVLVNAWLPLPALQYCFKNTESKFIIVDPERADVISSIAPRLSSEAKTKAIFVFGQISALHIRAGMRSWEDSRQTHLNVSYAILDEFPELIPEDDASITFTSGTTGLPKGVLSTHRQVLTNVRNATFAGLRAALRRGEDLPAISCDADNRGVLIPVPFFHVTGLTALTLYGTYMGMKLVLMRKWDKEEAAKLIGREDVAIAGGVPSMVSDLIESSLNHLLPGHHLTNMLFGGSPSPTSLPKRAKVAFPDTTLSQSYGMTETNSIAVGISGEDYLQRSTSTGIPSPVNDVIIVQDDVVLGHNQVGEVWIRGPNVMKCYWADPKATAKALTQDGWMKTGDLGMMDEEGFLYIKDRIKDLIIRGGENIDSVTVENALYDDPRVLEAAAVGIPDERLGELVGAVVHVKPESRQQITEAELIAACRTRLARFAVPVAIIFSDEPLAKTPSGKITKVPLRDLIKEIWAMRSASAAPISKL